jgi:cobalt-zinc-cadmium efflux system protein
MSTGHGSHFGIGTGKALAISAWLTGIYFVIELGIGIYTNSIAVISDAFHTFSAVGGVVLAIIAGRIAKRSADIDRTFGWYRAEIIGALLNGAFLLAMAILVIVMGAMRMRAPIELSTTPMLLAAAGGLVTEFISMYLLYRQQAGDLNIRGAFWHIIQTFVGSLLIIVSALVIRFTGFLLIDPLLGTAFGFILLWASWSIMRDALYILMEGRPRDIDLEAVIGQLGGLEGVADLHHVHAWTLTSGRHVFSAHIRLESGSENRANGADVLKAAHNILRREFGFFFSTLQIEDRCLDESTMGEIDITGLGPTGAHRGSGSQVDQDQGHAGAHDPSISPHNRSLPRD